MTANDRSYQREYMRKRRAVPGYKHWRQVKKEKLFTELKAEFIKVLEKKKITNAAKLANSFMKFESLKEATAYLKGFKTSLKIPNKKKL